MRRPGYKEILYVAHLLILSAMVKTNEILRLDLTIESPQTASADQYLNFSRAMPLFGVPNQMSIDFEKDGHVHIGSGEINVGSAANVSVSYGNVASSNYSAIDFILADFDVVSFTTAYAYMMKWTYANLTLQSESAWATDGNRTFYLVWHPVTDNATIAGRTFSVYSTDSGALSYVPAPGTIYVFEVESNNATELFCGPPATTTTSTTTTTTSTTTTSTMSPVSSAKITSANNWMLLTSLLLSVLPYIL